MNAGGAEVHGHQLLTRCFPMEFPVLFTVGLPTQLRPFGCFTVIGHIHFHVRRTAKIIHRKVCYDYAQ